MLHVYPITATAENWVHIAIYRKVRTAVEALLAGAAVPTWIEALPDDLQEREGLATRYTEFCAAAARLSLPNKNKVIRALEAQNNFPGVFDGASDCPRLDALPFRIRAPVRRLYEAAFDTLKSLKIRDRQYSAIFAVLPGKCCPFCGIEPFEAPGLAREDLDHYLPKHLYPFAGANLRNLVPMGVKCNRAYKGSEDIITNEQGQRRRCFDPYGQDRVEVSLLRSRPFEGEIEDAMRLPAWQIDFVGDAQAVETWDAVFHIRRRYAGKMNAHFREWIQQFAVWCEREVGLVETREQVTGAIQRYLNVVVQAGHGDAAHLQRAMFEMLRQHSLNGDWADRLVAWFASTVRAQHQLSQVAA